MSPRKRLSQANYSRLEFDGPTERNLLDYCLRNEIGLAQKGATKRPSATDFKFHATIVYSAVTHPDFLDESFDTEPLQLVPRQFQIFGADEPRLVLEFELDDALEALFRGYLETFGHQPDYRPYRPHLTFKGTKGLVEIVPTDLAMPDFPIVASRIVHEVR